jgi:hypothetical protein
MAIPVVKGDIVTRVTVDDKQYGPAITNATNQLKKFDREGQKVKGNLRIIRGGFGQLGHQVQDVAVQLQTGTDAFIVFGQQGSQIASLMGPGGAIVGAFLAVGAAVATTLFKFNQFGDALKDLDAEGLELAKNFNQLSDLDKKIAVGAVSEQAKTLANEIVDLDKQVTKFRKKVDDAEQAKAAHSDSQLIIVKDLPETERKLQKFINLREKAGEKLQDLLNSINPEHIQAEKVAEDFQKLSDTLDEQINTFGKTNEQIIRQSEVFKSLEADEKKVIEAKLQNIELLKKQAEESKKLAKQQIEQQKEMEKAQQQERQRRAQEFKQHLAEQEQLFEKNQQQVKNILGNVTDGFADAITGAENFQDAIKAMAKSVIDDLIRMAIQKTITDQIFGAITSAFPALFGTSTGGFNTVRSGSGSTQIPLGIPQYTEGPAPRIQTGYTNRANGGPVMGGSSYMVGERGPELFVPRQSGTIVPNGIGGVTINQSINISTGVQNTVRAEIANLMPQIQTATKNAVIDARNRGGSFSSQLVGA